MVGLSLFGKEGYGTPVFKIQVRALNKGADQSALLCAFVVQNPKVGFFPVEAHFKSEKD